MIIGLSNVCAAKESAVDTDTFGIKVVPLQMCHKLLAQLLIQSFWVMQCVVVCYLSILGKYVYLLINHIILSFIPFH